jgi:tripartite-type tricarboxylate transporter receptor subunit TctC
MNGGGDKMKKRQFLTAAGALGAALVTALAAPAALAQANWPERPVKIIVPYPPGGTTDLLARLMAAQLTESLGQSFVVDNRGGASGSIGAVAVARSPADGYTFLMGTISTHGINPVMVDVPYDALTDFQPVTNVADTPNVLSVNVDTPYKTLGDILEAARKTPGAITFGSTSPAGSPHMSGELLKAMAGVDLLHVPYKGGGPMLTDLIGGQIQLGFDNLPSSMPHIRSGKIRPIAVTTPERWPDAPDIPTIAESGVPGYEVSAWFGLLAPAGTPMAIVGRLQQAVAQALAKPEVAKQLLELGARPVGNTPEQFAEGIRAELEKWRKVAQANRLK